MINIWEGVTCECDTVPVTGGDVDIKSVVPEYLLDGFVVVLLDTYFSLLASDNHILENRLCVFVLDLVLILLVESYDAGGYLGLFDLLTDTDLAECCFSPSVEFSFYVDREGMEAATGYLHYRHLLKCTYVKRLRGGSIRLSYTKLPFYPSTTCIYITKIGKDQTMVFSTTYLAHEFLAEMLCVLRITLEVDGGEQRGRGEKRLATFTKTPELSISKCIQLTRFC